MISAVVLTKNEEKNIAKCLETLKFCDEIIIIDDYSSDKTVEIARRLGAKIYKRELGNDFAGQRNFGLKKAKGKWVFFLDADERVTPDLRSEIIQLINNPIIQYSGFFLRRRDYMWGRELKHGEIGGVRLLRLAKRTAGQWSRRVHEKWRVSGRTYQLKNPLFHYPHPTLAEFLKDINDFSTLHADANREEEKRPSLAKIVIWPTGKFIYNWIVRLGFLDGLAGFIVAAVMSFNSFLAWSKLWLTQRRT